MLEMTEPADEAKRLGRPLRTAIFGATGTTGVELTKLVERHPHCSIAYATSRGHAGESLRVVDPAAPNVALHAPDDVSLADLDLAFLCLPHGHSATQAELCLRAGVRCVDLSGDLRLADGDIHARVYGTPRSEAVAKEAVYAISELHGDAVPGARLVSNPGCYPTCSGLALEPLARAGWLNGPVIINALSGISGAGRKASAATHFCAVYDDVRPYKLGRDHRHAAEIEQNLAGWVPKGSEAPKVVFCPHVVPMERGMLTTIVADLPGHSAAEVHELFAERYADAPLVEVLPPGEPARIRAVARTPLAVIGVHDVAGTDHVVITSAIDNLLKGAASQALQNMNLALGYPETLGLTDNLGRAASPVTTTA